MSLPVGDDRVRKADFRSALILPSCLIMRVVIMDHERTDGAKRMDAFRFTKVARMNARMRARVRQTRQDGMTAKPVNSIILHIRLLYIINLSHSVYSVGFESSEAGMTSVIKFLHSNHDQQPTNTGIQTCVDNFMYTFPYNVSQK